MHNNSKCSTKSTKPAMDSLINKLKVQQQHGASPISSQQIHWYDNEFDENLGVSLKDVRCELLQKEFQQLCHKYNFTPSKPTLSSLQQDFLMTSQNETPNKLEVRQTRLFTPIRNDDLLKDVEKIKVNADNVKSTCFGIANDLFQGKESKIDIQKLDQLSSLLDCKSELQKIQQQSKQFKNRGNTQFE